MIKFYGTPLSPIKIFEEALTGKNVLIPFPRRDDFNRAVKLCNKIMIDNGAFTFWTKKKAINWDDYYIWVDTVMDQIDYFIIPDVIDGTEEENDQLIANYFKRNFNNRSAINKQKAIPVWHVAESTDRLERLMDTFDYIAFGSSGEYQTLGTKEWHKRMDEVMGIVCDKRGRPKVKIHMLRCLNPKIFTKYPFYSGDSTNLARNHKRDGWQNIINRNHYQRSPRRYKK